MIMDGKLYYVSDDGSYHKLCKIKELEETIMVDDENMFLHKEDPATVRSLRKSGYFEASMDFDHIDSKVFEIFASVDELIKKHQEYIELSWICELAKRYIVANSLNNLDTIEHSSCNGCVHKGAWENEVELGYNSPCTVCKRRASDWYEKGVSE